MLSLQAEQSAITLEGQQALSWLRLTPEINNMDISLWQMFVVLSPALGGGILEEVSLALSAFLG